MEIANLKAIGLMIAGVIVIIVVLMYSIEDDLDIWDGGIVFRGILGGLMLILAGYLMF